MVVGIYPRKLLFFIMVFALTFSAFKYKNYLVNQQEVNADISLDSNTIYASTSDNYNASNSPGYYSLEIDLARDGSLSIGNKKISETIKARDNYDELRYIIFDKPQEYFDKVDIKLNLPLPITKFEEEPQIIAVHGASPGPVTLSDDGTTLDFVATGVGSSSTVTIAAYFPKGYFNLPAGAVVQSGIESIPTYIWLAFAVGLPVLAIFVIFHMFSRRGLENLDNLVTTKSGPPLNLPPAVVSAIVFGHVGPRAIMATLIDLAQRGYIDIYNRGTDFVIHKKNLDSKMRASLLPYESVLLEKIFLSTQQVADSEDIEYRASRHLFSRKVALIYLEIYDYASSLGYFSEVPAKLHLKYRIAGIITFFTGLIGYLLSAFFAGDTKVILFLWLALVILGISIVKLAPSITNYTTKGKQAVVDWLSFKNFLSQGDILRKEEDVFEAYLAYSVAMGVESYWSARFIESNFAIPKWYDAIARIDGIENFAKSLLPIIDYIADTLNVASEPLVK